MLALLLIAGVGRHDTDHLEDGMSPPPLAPRQEGLGSSPPPLTQVAPSPPINVPPLSPSPPATPPPVPWAESANCTVPNTLLAAEDLGSELKWFCCGTNLSSLLVPSGGCCTSPPSASPDPANQETGGSNGSMSSNGDMSQGRRLGANDTSDGCRITMLDVLNEAESEGTCWRTQPPPPPPPPVRTPPRCTPVKTPRTLPDPARLPARSPSTATGRFRSIPPRRSGAAAPTLWRSRPSCTTSLTFCTSRGQCFTQTIPQQRWR